MSRFIDMGFTNIVFNTSTDPEIGGYVGERNGYPYNIHPTITPEEWSALQEAIAEGDITINEYEPPEIYQPTYAEKRAAEYPPMADYLDGIVKGDQVQVQAYIDACLAVKAKYPKPQGE